MAIKPRKKPSHRSINLLTTPLQIADAADLIWHHSEKMRNSILAGCNLSTQFRDKLNRTIERQQHYARSLAEAMPLAYGASAFDTPASTRSILAKLVESTNDQNGT